MSEETKDLKDLAVEAIENLPDGREMHWINHLLEDSLSTSRVQHILAFLSELSLQVDHEDFSDAMTRDAMQGLGWILQSCHQALALQEELMLRERHTARVKAVEQSAAAADSTHHQGAPTAPFFCYCRNICRLDSETLLQQDGWDCRTRGANLCCYGGQPTLSTGDLGSLR